MGLRSQGRKVTSEDPTPQGVSLKIKRKKDTGRPNFSERGPKLYFPGKFIHLELYIENNGRCRVMQGQQF